MIPRQAQGVMVVKARTVLVLIVGLVCGLVISPMTTLLLLVPPDQHDDGDHYRHPRSVQEELQSSSALKQNSNSPTGTKNHDLQLVGISVLSSSKQLHGRATAAYHTYGRNLCSKEDFRVYTYPTGITNKKRKNNKETPFSIKYMKSPQQQESTTVNNNSRSSSTTPNNIKSAHFIHLLEHLCQTKVYINYHFLLLIHDNTYVNIKNLHKLVQSFLMMSIQPPLYTGGILRSPTDSSTLRNQCSTKNGLLLHQNAFKKLCPNIHQCSNYRQWASYGSSDEDEIVNKCLQNLLFTSCWSPTQVDTVFYQDKDDKLKSITQQQQLSDHSVSSNIHGLIKEAVTIHPVSDSVQFTSIHRAISEMLIDSLLKDTKSEINNLMSAIPKNSVVSSTTKFPSNHWFQSYLNANPKSKHDVLTWSYCNSSKIYQIHEHQPSQGLLKRHKTSINNALQVAVEQLNSTEEVKGFLSTPYRVNECFIAMDESKGMKYVLNFTVKMKHFSDPVKYIASVTLPLNGPGLSTSQPVTEFTDTIVNLVLPVAHYHNLIPFLEMFENEFMLSRELVHLHLVFFSRDEVIRRKVSQIERIYSGARVTIHDIPGNNPYSIFHAYNYVAEKLHDAELMLFYDVSLKLSKHFLNHCRMNAIRGRQVYSPIAFSQYKSEMVSTTSGHQQADDLHITSDTGFFVRYNYQALCIYRSDFAKVGGYKRSKTTSESQGNEEFQLLENILRSSIYLMRSVEPFLIKSFHYRKCNDLKSKSARESCVKSVSDTIGSKKSLGTYLLNHDLL